MKKYDNFIIIEKALPEKSTSTNTSTAITPVITNDIDLKYQQFLVTIRNFINQNIVFEKNI